MNSTTLINNYSSSQSSCYFLDIRNSTNIIKAVSLDLKSGSGPIHPKDSEKLIIHSNFMLDLHRFLFSKLKDLSINDYYFNNTGDGHVCLLWNKTHAWTLLDIVCSISIFLEKRINEYQSNYLRYWSEEYKKDLTIGYGIGVHSGGSIIVEDEQTREKFAYGVVLNSAARTESFTKNFTELSLLLTRNFKIRLQKQFRFLELPKLKTWEEYDKLISAVTLYAVDTKDSKSSGHLLYTISRKYRTQFITT